MENMANWMDLGMIWSLEERYELKPYWPKDMDNETQASRVREFERKIYPIWAPIWQRYCDSDGVSERQAIHKCDLEICESGIKPAREFLGAITTERQRNRAAAGNRFANWTENGDDK